MKNFLCMMVGFVAIAQIGLAATPTATVGGIKWSYTVENGKAVIGGGFFTAISTATKGEVTIPSQIAGYTVVAINDYALSECVNLTGVIIPSGIETIGEFAFYGCSSLKKVVFPKSVKTIKQYAFYECPSLENVDVSDVGDWCGVDFGNASSNPLNSSGALYCNGGLVTELVVSEGVKEIKPNAFCGCTRIKRVDLPASIEEIGLGAFKGCNSIEWIRVPFVGNKRGLVGNTNFGHIFGASSYVRNKEAVPTSLKSIVVSDDCIIAESAFEGCSGIESMIISKSVVSIGNGAFYGCSGILNIELPFVGSERGVGGDPNFGYVFGTQYDSSSEVVPLTLKTVKITDETSIANCAFQGCSNITKIEVVGSVKSIGNQAFSGCTSLTDILLPNMLTSIGGKAFENCISLETIRLPVSVVNIGSWIFAGCENLTAVLVDGAGGAYSSVDGVLYSADQQELVYVPSDKVLFVVPATVKRIRAYAFANLTKLEQVVISDGVEEIGADAFYGCQSLTSIEFPSSVVKIGTEALKGCSSIKRVVVPFVGSNRGVSVTSNFAHLFSGYGLGGNVPTSLEEVCITDDNDIASDAFSWCSSVKSISISSSVTNMGKRIFYECKSLERLIIPFLGATDNASSRLSYLFSDASDANKYVVPLSLRTVSLEGGAVVSSAFEGCPGIESVVLGEAIKTIGKDAFASCANLQSVCFCGGSPTCEDFIYGSGETLSPIVTTYVKEGCTGWDVSSQEWQGLPIEYWYDFPLIPACQLKVTFDLCGHAQRIGGGQLVQKVKSGRAATPPEISVDKGWKHLGWAPDFLVVTSNLMVVAQYIERLPCSYLSYYYDSSKEGYVVTGFKTDVDVEQYQELVIPELIEGEKVVEIGDYAFYQCSSFHHVTIPDGVIRIGESAFRECHGLYRVEIPDSVRTVGKNAFRWCSALSQATLSENMTTIPYGMFADSNLERIVIPEGVLSIGDVAFYYCAHLREVSIPDSLTSVGNDAFSMCTVLCDYDYIYSYQNNGWLLKWDVEYGPSDIVFNGKGIGDGVFKGSKRITSVKIGENIKWLGSSTFENCTSLKTVVLQQGLSKITKGAFNGCSSLESIAIPQSVKHIDRLAFENCSSLTSIEIPDGVETIGDGAFYGCDSLKSIKLPFVGSARGADQYDWFGYIFGVDEWPCYYRDYSKTIPSCLKKVIITDDTAIGNYAFYNCKSIESVELSDNVETIGWWAFGDCSNLKDVVWSRWLKEIGDSSFYNTSLSSIILPIGFVKINESAFQSIRVPVSIAIPESVVEIGNSAFAYTTLTSVSTSRSDASRVRCLLKESGVDLTNVEFVDENLNPIVCTVLFESQGGSSVPKRNCKFGQAIGELDEPIFAGHKFLGWYTSSVGGVKIEPNTLVWDDVTYYAHWQVNQDELSVTFDANGGTGGVSLLVKYGSLALNVAPVVNRMGYAFEGWFTASEGGEMVTSSTIVSADVTYYAHWVEESLEDFVISGGVLTKYIGKGGVVRIPSVVTRIGVEAFGDCTDVETLIIPAGVKSIGQYAFHWCSGIQTMIISEGVTNIEQYAFCGCSGLKSVTIPSSLKVFGNDAFYRCTGLESVIISDGVTAIGKYAFAYCSKLESIVIPSSVAKIGDYAFYGCSVLFVHVGSGETERVKGLYDWPSGVKFIEPAIPSVEGDSGAMVTGDVETGFVVKPSAEKTTVAVAIPQGVDASKVTVEVSPKVVSVKLNGAKMKIVNGVDDITEFLDVPPANKDGVIDLSKATVKEEIVNETMDTEKGAVIKLDAVNPTLTTPNTRKGLFYQLREGVTIDGMNNGDSILGDGKPWTPTIKVKGGASAFYTISVGK